MCNNKMPTSLNDYKLCVELVGHSADVRAVCSGPLIENGKQILASGSRDKTTKIWRPEGNIYVNSLTWQHHKNFVSTIYYYDTEKWFCTGSNDNDICLYGENDVVPFAILKGHGSTVCSIAGGIQARSIISGSWDKTARIWHIDLTGHFTSIILKGHEAAVWAVASLPEINKFITGSADKNIFYWNAQGEKLRTLKGHTDCVRGVLPLNNGCLVSCANDAIIRYWNEDGECTHEMSGHTNYIYSIAQHKALGDNYIVSCGEDSTVRMWDLSTGQEMGSPLTHPAQSVWSVACLQNGDILTGSSDGIVRIFTKDSTRFANANTLMAYDTAVQTRKAQISEEFGGMKKTDLPGPEALLSQGKREGQTLMVRYPDGTVKCYNWSMGNWNLIGDVTGAAGGTQASSGKTLFEGKEYDYVFSVDISDTQAPIKLPYNRGEDPWHSAQAFILRHNLAQAYLDTVANFIIKNSNQLPVQTHAPTSTSTYQDPFTGGNRYVPGSSVSNFQTSGNADPFTGNSSYSTTNTITSSSKDDAAHFPTKRYLTFDTYDASKILTKLKEFNSKLPSNIEKITESALEDVIKLAESPQQMVAINTLKLLLQWPKEFLFPVIDVCRLAIRNEWTFLYLNSDNFLDTLLSYITTSSANQLMIVRCFVNIMTHQPGRQEVEKRLVSVIDYLKNIKSGSANLQIAIATFYLNISITQIVGVPTLEKCCLITEGLIELLKWDSINLEATYRSMQAIGNLSTTSFSQEVCVLVKSVDCVLNRLRESAQTPQPEPFAKVNSIGVALLAVLL